MHDFYLKKKQKIYQTKASLKDTHNNNPTIKVRKQKERKITTVRRSDPTGKKRRPLDVDGIMVLRSME